MGGNSDNLLIFQKCILGTLDTIFQGQKTFCSVGGSLSWSEMPYFYKGGPLQMVQELPLSAKCKEFFFFKQLYLVD